MIRLRFNLRSRLAAATLALLGGSVVGCKNKIIQEPGDWPEGIPGRIPKGLEEHPADLVSAPVPPGAFAPATIVDTDRQLRKMTLKEALAIAIEGGNVGSQALNGTDNLILPTFTGRGTNGTDTIRAFLFDPAIAGAEIERSLSKFDARWINSLVWQKQDQPTLSLQQSFSNGDTAQLQSTLAKPLPTGGIAAITTSVSYLNLSTPPTNNNFVSLTTSYTPQVQFIFEQPLLQGFGVEANQLINTHPGSLLVNGLRASGGAGTEGILVTRVRNAQARSNFDTEVNQMILNVEAAYWNLFAAYYNLYAQEEGLKGSYRYFKFLEARKDVDVPTLLPQARAQYWLFRQQVLQARSQVLSSDRSLRGLLGMRSDDGTVLIPNDQPSLAKLPFDYNEARAEALQGRPELNVARQEVKAQQLNLLAQRNLRLPDVRAYGSYSVQGLGSNLFGNSQDALGNNNSALGSLGRNIFNSYQIGLRADMPLGFRDSNALVRQSQLSLWKSYEQLRDAERKTQENLVDAVRQLELGWATLEVTRSRRTALEDQYNRIRERIDGGVWRGVEEQNSLIIALRDLATATADEYRAIANYNTALAQIEYAKGTIQRYDHVTVNEGPLPAHVQKKASDHFRARGEAIKLREHPAELPLTALDRYQPTPLDQYPPPGTGYGAPMPAAQPGPVTPLPGPLPSPVPAPMPGPTAPTERVIALPGSVTPWDPRVATPIRPDGEFGGQRSKPMPPAETNRPANPPVLDTSTPVFDIPPR